MDVTVADLADFSAGPELGAALAALDVGELDGHDAVLLLKAWSRQRSYTDAELLSAIHQVVRITPGPQPKRRGEVRDTDLFEVSAALTWTRQTTTRQAALADGLIERLPQVFDALESGQIDLPKAAVFVKETAALSLKEARAAADEVLPLAPGLTTGQIRARLHRAAIRKDPRAAMKRHVKKVAERKVIATPSADGTGFILALNLPADRAAAAMERLDAMARKSRDQGDERKLDQLKADILLDLLGGTYEGPGPIFRKGAIELVVPLTTLMGLTDLPGDLAGWGPLVADLARKVAEQQAAAAQLRFKVIDDYGHVVANGTTRRRPPAKMAAFVRAVLPRCIAPGCRRPSHQCQLDHRIRYVDHGRTDEHNLNPLCSYHHRCKDEGGWRLLRTRPGHFVWISPHEHRYVVDVEDDLELSMVDLED